MFPNDQVAALNAMSKEAMVTLVNSKNILIIHFIMYWIVTIITFT